MLSREIKVVEYLYGNISIMAVKMSRCIYSRNTHQVYFLGLKSFSN